ncbi:hypothetical protein D3C80_778550 [compost metagenome]
MQVIHLVHFIDKGIVLSSFRFHVGVSPPLLLLTKLVLFSLQSIDSLLVPSRQLRVRKKTRSAQLTNKHVFRDDLNKGRGLGGIEGGLCLREVGTPNLFVREGNIHSQHGLIGSTHSLALTHPRPIRQIHRCAKCSGSNSEAPSFGGAVSWSGRRIVHGHYSSLVDMPCRNKQTNLPKIQQYIVQNSRPFRHLLFGYSLALIPCRATAFAHERRLQFAALAHSKYVRHLEGVVAIVSLFRRMSGNDPVFQTTSGVLGCI